MRVAIICIALFIGFYGGYKLYNVANFSSAIEQDIHPIDRVTAHAPPSSVIPNIPPSDVLSILSTPPPPPKPVTADRRYNSHHAQEILASTLLIREPEISEGELLIFISNSEIEATDFAPSTKLLSVAHQWHCNITSELSCSEKGCEDIDSPIWLELDLKEKLYRRCDGDICDESRMIITSGKKYTTLSLPSQAVSLRIANVDNSLTGAFSQGGAVITLFGQCIPVLRDNEQAGYQKTLPLAISEY